MSCFKNYLPQPPRDWSRVQNTCIELTLSEANQIAISNKKMFYNIRQIVVI